MLRLEYQDQRHPLRPLLEGKPVILTVTDSKVIRKKRVVTLAIVITPLSVYGMDSTDLLISMPGYGSEIVHPGVCKASDLYRLGLSMVASKLLAVELHKLYNVRR